MIAEGRRRLARWLLRLAGRVHPPTAVTAQAPIVVGSRPFTCNVRNNVLVRTNAAP